MSEDTLETLTKSKVDIDDTEIEAARGCTKLHETAQGPVETAEASEEAVEEELWAEHPTYKVQLRPCHCTAKSAIKLI